MHFSANFPAALLAFADFYCAIAGQQCELVSEVYQPNLQDN